MSPLTIGAIRHWSRLYPPLQSSRARLTPTSAGRDSPNAASAAA
eukprot:CAMPEP_0180130134 /NCGR_PEP_ID=MMETSP0986-20121125/7696_1 /TAXON_ID=697907 /ORGANISM="non described non described, Strain CCMP2293" /LENGTH=43 /DNA_ID= /DNA_START= /DNA_END= /DNA_ORIENTATION=